MVKSNKISIEEFTQCMSKRCTKIIDRAVALLYFYAVEKKCGASPRKLSEDFKKMGLGSPNITRLRAALAKDRRTIKISKDEWSITNDKIKNLEESFQLDNCLSQGKKVAKSGSEYVNSKRIDEISSRVSSHDFSRLLQMLSELNFAFSNENYISVILLLRAILDHVPPIFSFNTFIEVANNYGNKSFKESMSNLEKSSRKIADSYLHTPIRNKESLPNKTQVDFSNDLDCLLAEICRIV